MSIIFEYRGVDVAYEVVENPVTGKFWLDRNLGASRVATAYNDSLAYGDLFQWGRLDDGHQDRGSGTTSTNSSEDIPGHSDFILETVSPYDWRVPQNNALWNAPDYTNCIAEALSQGFRVPTEAELNAERLSWSSNNTAGAWASPLKLTAAGFRYYSTGSLYYVGSYGYYWSSTVGGTAARYLYFAGGDANVYSHGRAYGFSVRLIYDESLDVSSVSPPQHLMLLGVG